MTDRKQPVPAPPGTHWVITESLMDINGRSAFTLGLWDAGVTPDRHGSAYEDGPDESVDAWSAIRRPIFPLGTGYFTKPTQIRRESKRVIRDVRAKQAYTDLATSLYENGATA